VLTLFSEVKWVLYGLFALYLTMCLIQLVQTIVTLNCAEKSFADLSQFKSFLNYSFVVILGLTVRLLTCVFIVAMVGYKETQYIFSA
jgi:hypothetical protein